MIALTCIDISLDFILIVMEILGEGSFGLITKCHNAETGQMEAIKIFKSRPNFIHDAQKEIGMLKRLQCLDPDSCNIVKWNNYFFDKEIICLSFELLDQNLRDYILDRECRGLPISEVRSIIHQLTTALSHLNSLGIVHADLKPDNVMVVDRHQQPLKVKLVDFGLAQLLFAIKSDVPVQSLWYRAPEVMLDIPFNEAIDVWSLGITAGQPADDVLDRGKSVNYYFNKEINNPQHWKFKTPQEGQHILVDLIKRMLHLNPDERIKPLEVLQHPFFSFSVHHRSPTTEISQQPNSFQKVEQDWIEFTTASLASGAEKNNDYIQPESPEGVGWFRRLIRWIATCYCFFPSVERSHVTFYLHSCKASIRCLLNLPLTELRLHTFVELNSVPCGLIISAQKPLLCHWAAAAHNKSLPRTSEIEVGIPVT
uniref:Protein kinase domain-containing protein n=1 Tax=Mola mola TaxID=94237 RepID=A0A3Q3VU06_MOLML